MYKGTNPKALLSIRLITEGFLAELRSKPYEQINVRELCRTADVSRQTFYNIFKTKDDVLRRCIDDIFNAILARQSASGTLDARQAIHIFVDTFYENREFMVLLIQNGLERVLTEEFVFAISGLSRTKGVDSNNHLDYHLAFYAGGLTQILIHWMQDEKRVASDELIEILSESIQLPYFT